MVEAGTNSRTEDPYLNMLFALKMDDMGLADFSECSGLSLEVTTEDYIEGGENRYVHKFPVRAAPPNLVLQRGLTHSTDLWDWFQHFVESDKVVPKDGQIHLLKEPGSDDVLRAWAFTRAYPVKWTGPSLNAMSPGIAFETLELVHHGIRIVK